MKILKNMFFVALSSLSLGVLAVPVAHAQTSCWSCERGDDVNTVDLWGGHFVLSRGETESVQLDGFRHVRKVIVQAEGLDSLGGSFEVIVNGDVKGTVYVPGQDPSYVVTVESAASSIQFRHSGGGRIAIRNVKAVQSLYGVDAATSHAPFMARNEAAGLARKAIALVDELENYANYNEYGTYLLPIKVAAGQAYAVASARGELSQKTRTSLLRLRAEIEAARAYLTTAFQRNAAFDLCVELLSVSERLDQILH
jgi:hypothetical protein